MEFDKIICGNAITLSKFIPKNTIDFVIINLPYLGIYKKSSKHVDLFKKILKETAMVTKVGGICCLVVGDYIEPKQQVMDMSPTMAFFEVKNDPNLRKKWIFDDQMIWIKSPRKSSMSSDSLGIEMASFEDTPFSYLQFFVRVNSESYTELNIPQRIKNLKISHTKKTEMLNSFWYIQPKSEKGFKDYLPKELVSRLVMLFSQKGDTLLDPFAGHGISAIVAKTLKRHYFCIEKDSKKVAIINKRLQSMNKYKKLGK